MGGQERRRKGGLLKGKAMSREVHIGNLKLGQSYSNKYT